MVTLDTSVKETKMKRKLREKDLKPDSAESEHSEEENDESESTGTRESDDDSGDNDDEASEDEKPSSRSNAGWADAMQKILKTNKPKRKKTIVLSKAKKLREVKSKEGEEAVPFEIETEDGKIKREVLVKSEEDGDDKVIVKKRKKESLTGIRVKPSILDRERERALQKIATKGVVQLFNVVKQQQIEIDKKIEEVGPVERKREKVLKSIDKRAFLDVLMGGSKSIPVDDTKEPPKSEDNSENKSGVWNVLRDDFVMGANLKDWDKNAPEEQDDSSSSEEMDSD